jgi:hypothetical protein
MAAPFHQSTDAHEDSDIVGKTMQDNVDPKNGSETEDVVENSGKGKVVPFVSTAKLIKNRHNNHIDRDTVAASRTDQDVVTDIIDNIDTIERVAKSASLLRHVAPEAAKHQRDTRLAAAKQGFDMSLLKIKPVPVPANDNIVQTLPVPVNDNAVSFKETESWPLIDQLNRTIFEPDETKRQKFIGTVHHIRDLIDTARADPLGLSVHRPGKEATPDHDLQRMESGKVWFEQSQTLDRRERTYDYRDGEIDAKRFDGPVRTAKRSPGAVSNGFDSNRDDPFAQRRIDAQMFLIQATRGRLCFRQAGARDRHAVPRDQTRSFKLPGIREGTRPSCGRQTVRTGASRCSTGQNRPLASQTPCRD